MLSSPIVEEGAACILWCTIHSSRNKKVRVGNPLQASDIFLQLDITGALANFVLENRTKTKQKKETVIPITIISMNQFLVYHSTHFD